MLTLFAVAGWCEPFLLILLALVTSLVYAGTRNEEMKEILGYAKRMFLWTIGFFAVVWVLFLILF